MAWLVDMSKRHQPEEILYDIVLKHLEELKKIVIKQSNSLLVLS